MRYLQVFIGAAFAVAGLPTALWAQQTGQSFGRQMWGGGWHGWFVGPVMMIVFLAIVVVVVVLIVRWLAGPGHGPVATPHGPGGKTPLDILKERFARGEIDQKEFGERRKVLGD